MKTLAALACAGLIAGAGVLWFSSNPVVVGVTRRPLQPNAAIPTFKPVTDAASKSDNVRPPR